jgi:hypothetical protein
MVNAGWEFVGAPRGGPIPYGMRVARADPTITTVGERESKCGGTFRHHSGSPSAYGRRGLARNRPKQVRNPDED